MLLRLVVWEGSCIFERFLLRFLLCNEMRKQCEEGSIGKVEARSDKHEAWCIEGELVCSCSNGCFLASFC
jgi:hypothetical protein